MHVTKVSSMRQGANSHHLSSGWRIHLCQSDWLCTESAASTETERSSGWMPYSSLETLKTSFNVSSDDQGSHSDDLSVAVSIMRHVACLMWNIPINPSSTQILRNLVCLRCISYLPNCFDILLDFQNDWVTKMDVMDERDFTLRYVLEW